MIPIPEQLRGKEVKGFIDEGMSYIKNTILVILTLVSFISCAYTTEEAIMHKRKMEEIYNDGQIWLFEDQMKSKYRHQVDTVGEVSTWIYAHKNLQSIYILKFNMADNKHNIYLKDKYIKVQRKPCFYLGIDINKDGVIDVSFIDKDRDGGLESIYYHGNDPNVIYNELQRQGSNRLFDKPTP